jgi:MFS family permease
MNTTTEKRGSNVTPFFLGLLGFLVYYGLFASFDRTTGWVSHEALRTVASVWKLLVFSITMWRVGDYARTNRKRFFLWGATFAVFGSALLLVLQIWSPSGQQMFSRLLVESIEAVGEALICAGLVSHVREETLGNDWRYFRITTGLRVGQNTGMVLAILAGIYLWGWIPRGYSIALLGLRIGVAILLIRMVRTGLIRDYPRQHVIRRRCAMTLKVLFFDVIVGACSYALFFLVAMGPSVAIDQKRYQVHSAFALNGAFALIAMVIIHLLASNVHNSMPAKRALLKFEIRATIGAVMVIASWMILFWTSISGDTFFLLVCAGLLGLFTTSTYVLSELSSGLYGKPKDQTAQLVSYFGLARFGQIASLVMILLSKQAKMAEMLSEKTAAAIVEICVALGCAGIVLGVVKKWKLDEKGGQRGYT